MTATVFGPRNVHYRFQRIARPYLRACATSPSRASPAQARLASEVDKSCCRIRTRRKGLRFRLRGMRTQAFFMRGSPHQRIRNIQGERPIPTEGQGTISIRAVQEGKSPRGPRSECFPRGCAFGLCVVFLSLGLFSPNGLYIVFPTWVAEVLLGQ